LNESTRVLVIEDRPEDQTQFKDWLEDGGYHVEVADDAEDGLEQFRQNVHDVILLDIDLPGIDGIEALRQIKEIEPSTCVIMITGHADFVQDTGSALRTGQLGASKYLVKGTVYKYDLLREIEESLKWQEERDSGGIETVSEAIVVVDLVDSTKKATRHGWFVVREMIHKLRECIKKVGARYGLCCRKFTGDGYMLAFRKDGDSAQAAIKALRAVIAICREIEAMNDSLPKERRIELRFAIHYGEVDADNKANDREGPNVSFTFRLEGVKVPKSKNASEDPPTHNYAIVSQTVAEILKEREVEPYVSLLEPMRPRMLKGFTAKHRLFLLRNVSKIGSSHEVT
jgi:CheY-like chemotaxis protein